MADFFLLIPIIVSFFAVLLLTPYWIRKAKQIGLLWEDMNKYSSSKVAGSGGIIVVGAFILGVLFYIAYRVFAVKSADLLIEILALLVVILLAGGIGFIDDLFGWRHGGLSKRSRLILLAFSAIPLMVINAGRSQIGIPFLGTADIGILYPLIFIPIGIIGATSTFNFLAGFNGLESGQGILILSALAIVSLLMGHGWLVVISLCMIASLFAFLLYNWYPAKIFPGDVLTYSTGALIAVISIFGNFERVAVFFFIPVIIEVILKSRGRLKKYSFGKPSKDGSINLRYDKIYSLNHLSIFIMNKLNIRATEKKVVISIWLFQILIIVLGFIIFKNGIFLNV